MSFSQLYFSFDGRISRGTFWLKGFLPIIVISFVVGLIDGLAEAEGILVLVWQLLILWPGLALTAKRWHDRDKSGWWILIGLIPIIGGIWALIETGFLEGSHGPNRFGPESF